jgi:hypothetical protein
MEAELDRRHAWVDLRDGKGGGMVSSWTRAAESDVLDIRARRQVYVTGN